MSLLPTFSILGSGPTVLLLHDADGDYLTFAPQVEMLASAGYRAVAWNMPGYGHSAPIEPYTFKGLAQSCVALIEALQCGPVTLVGHGMGAMLALEVAVRRAEVLNRLVLCAGGPALDAQAVEDWLTPRERALDVAQQPGGSMQQLAQALVPQCIGPGALPEGVRLAEHALAQVHPATYRRALQAMQGFDRWAQAWVNVHTPTLIVGGEADHCTPPAALQALARLMPDARHLSLPHIGHWPQLESPEAFDAALLDFLTTQRVLH